jgi:hypothetical protein
MVQNQVSSAFRYPQKSDITMTSQTSPVKIQSNGTEDLNKMLPVPFNSTANEATTPGLPATSSKGPFTDEDGFITPHPIKEKRHLAKKDPKQPEFRGKFPPKAQAETSSAPAKNGSANNKRIRQRQGPRGEVQIGSLHSKVKSSGPSTTQPTASSQPEQQQQQQPAGKGDSTNTVKSATQPSPNDTQTQNQTQAQPQTKAATKSEPHLRRPKSSTTSDSNGQQTKRVIVFDANYNISWADEVIEDEAVKARPASQPAKPSPSTSSSAGKEKEQARPQPSDTTLSTSLPRLTQKQKRQQSKNPSAAEPRESAHEPE